MARRRSVSEFIDRSKGVHGNRYDYSKVTYQNNYTPVEIVCHIHGSFMQQPAVHTRGSGCRLCAIDRTTLDSTEFTDKARAAHGDTYDYSRVEYQNAKTKVLIGCKIHGWFEQLADNHLRGMGCPDCGLNVSAKKRQLGTEEFLERAKSVHGDRYEYPPFVYERGTAKIKIICKEHGAFNQAITDHLSGKGCPECAKTLRGLKKRLSPEEFLAKAREVHGEKYDYTASQYSKSNVPLPIECPTHGAFWQLPSNHLRGAGCPECGNEISSQRQRASLADFISAACEVHGERYDYSRVAYINARTAVEIICEEHGSFEQVPYSHLIGNGCPICGIAKRAATQAINFDDFAKSALEVHGGKYSYEHTRASYTSLSAKAYFLCDEHGEFEQTPETHIRGTGCPSCNESHGERAIANWLIANDIPFSRQHQFEGLIGRRARRLSYDFFLPTFRALIEYDGIQHFESVKKFGGEKKLRRTQKYDRLKDAWAEENGLILKRIRYDEKSLINIILSDFINEIEPNTNHIQSWDDLPADNAE